jgi:hypothetical protein
MRKILATLVVVLFVSATYASGVYSVPKEKAPIALKASEMFVPMGKAGAKISLLDLSMISVKDFQTLTGKKLKLSEKVSFRIMQKQLRNSINPDGTFDSKKLEKVNMTKKATEQSRKYLRLWLILLGAAIILTILGIFVPFLWILGAIAGLGATVFFILWIIALAG